MAGQLGANESRRGRLTMFVSPGFTGTDENGEQLSKGLHINQEVSSAALQPRVGPSALFGGSLESDVSP